MNVSSKCTPTQELLQAQHVFIDRIHMGRCKETNELQSVSKAWFLITPSRTAVKIYIKTGTTTQEFLKVRLI